MLHAAFPDLRPKAQLTATPDLVPKPQRAGAVSSQDIRTFFVDKAAGLQRTGWCLMTLFTSYRGEQVVNLSK